MPEGTDRPGTDEAGAVLGDRYELGPVIGRGGHADVYRATDRVLGRQVAVKILRDVRASEADRARFAAETQTVARLNHPNLVTVLDAGSHDDQPFLVMEYVDGPSLAEVKGVALHPSRVAALGSQLAAALGHAHDAGVIHRDVKPGNVLLGKDGRARLTDFGIARLIGDATGGHTATGTTIGTAAYLSPEQVRGDTVTPAADIYALGLVLLESMTGVRAYPGSATESALARLHRPPEMPADVSPGWARLLESMTAQDPAQRPTAAQVATAAAALGEGLDPAEATQAIRLEAENATRVIPAQAPAPDATQVAATPVEPTPVAQTPSPKKPPKKKPIGLIATIVAVVAILVVGAILLDQAGQGPPDGVPSELQSELQDLHDAVNGE